MPQQTRSLIICAYSIHGGGGKAVLDSFLSQHGPDTALLLLDQRANISADLSDGILLKRVPPNAIARFNAERFLAKLLKERGDIEAAIFFGSLPPLFRLSVHTKIYLQNRFLVDKRWISWMSGKTVVRSILERLWFNLFMNNADSFIVQTKAMEILLAQKTTKPITKELFFDASALSKLQWRPSRYGPIQLIYIASGEPHKNHKKLIEALVGIPTDSYELSLTVSKESAPKLYKWICRKIRRHSLPITLRVYERDALMEKLSTCHALIFPSLFETVGLPLLEADAIGVPIIASNLDFVTEHVSPVALFDPARVRSIHNAIHSYLKQGTFLYREPVKIT